MTELAGKGKRVVGTFVLMVGAGVILDSHLFWLGIAIALVGALGLAWGALEARPRPVVVPRATVPERPPMVSRPTQSNP